MRERLSAKWLLFSRQFRGMHIDQNNVRHLQNNKSMEIGIVYLCNDVSHHKQRQYYHKNILP